MFPLPAESVMMNKKEICLARRGGSYKFEKRQKEIKKQKKRQAKLERPRQSDANPGEATTPASEDAVDESPEPETEPVS